MIKLQTQKTKIASKVKKTQILIELKHLFCDTTQNSFSDNSNSEKGINCTQSFGNNNLTPQQPMRCTLGSVLIS